MQITKTVETNTSYSSQVLLQHIINYIEALEKTTNNEALCKFIQTEFTELLNNYTTVGDQEYNRYQEQESADLKEVYILHFKVSEGFKDIALLHRNVLLQLQIARCQILEESITSVKLDKHFEISKEILLKATNELTTAITNKQTAVYESKKTSKKLLASIKHRKNPWVVYKSQFETIKNQVKDIINGAKTTSRLIKVFGDIRTHNSTFLNQLITDTDTLKKHQGEAIKSIKKLKDPEEISAIISWIDKTLLSISKDMDLQESYVDSIENKLKILSEHIIPVQVEDGLLLTKKIDFNTDAKKWFDFEILPVLIDLWENKNNMFSYFKLSLANLKSSLLVDKSNDSLKAIPSQLQTLQNAHAVISTNATKIEKIATEIETKFTNQFLIAKIYTNEDFLEVSLQSSLTHLASEHSNFFTTIKNKLGSRFSSFNTKYDRSNLFKNQNKIEGAIQSINYRMFKEDSEHYDTLFLNKNLIGDLFLLPREEQEIQFNNSILQWKNGFNKAIIITGDRLSGKSTFVEYVGQKHFEKDTIHIKSNATITYGGRKFSTTKNLKEALQNIKKGFSNVKPFIVIDDLELWRNNEFSLLDNTRALLSFISSESDNAFIVVTTSKQMQSHLDKRLRFSEAFSATISMNKASIDEIKKAILQRHGASHKILIAENGEPFTTKLIEQNILKISRRLNYNIGEILQAWSYSTTVLDTNKVIYEDKEISFKDFFNAEEVIILKYTMLYKTFNEIEFKNFFNKSYETTYKPSLKRLTNTKVLLRGTNGLLKLNPVICSDIKQILTYKGVLN